METLINKLENIIDDVIFGTEELKFNKDSAQQLYSVCLCGTILELACGCLALYKTNNHNCVPGVTRSLLEAYVDLVNLIKDEEYVLSMNVAYLKQRANILKSALGRGKSNPYLEKTAKWEELESQSKKTQSEIDNLKEKGIYKLQVSDRFDRAELIDLYDSVYASLCQHSHNNLNVLEKRHLIEHNNEIRVEFFQYMDKSEIIPIVETIAGLLVDSMRKLWFIVNIKDNSPIAKAEKSLKDLRSLY